VGPAADGGHAGPDASPVELRATETVKQVPPPDKQPSLLTELGAPIPQTLKLVVSISEIETRALIDSGASLSFMDAKFARRTGVPLVPLDPPCQVILGNGSTTLARHLV